MLLFFTKKDFQSENGNALISFSKNDLDFELAYRVHYEELQARALFPHIFVKNVTFEVNYGQLNRVRRMKYPLRSTFRFLNEYDEDQRIRGTLGPTSQEECEVNIFKNSFLYF